MSFLSIYNLNFGGCLSVRAITQKRLVRKSSFLVDRLRWVWGCAFWRFCEIRGTSEISPTPPQKTTSALQTLVGVV